MLNITRINTADPRSREQIAALRAKLATDGDVVSEAGRKKTIETFGEPLMPMQVIERICRDVRQRGLAAVLEFTAKLDGKTLSADQIRVSSAELAAAHKAASPDS
jgi:histidinol dehydrogenase